MKTPRGERAFPAKGFRLAVLWIIFLASVHVLGSAWAADLPGSKDHPQLKRFRGSEIIAYETKRFDTYELQTSTFKRYDLGTKRREFAEPPLKLEGARTQIW